MDIDFLQQDKVYSNGRGVDRQTYFTWNNGKIELNIRIPN